ncbi:MAG: nucleotidyltransferase domain-containing protein, partial [Myxococcales bacterium]|nr:nucleotidyltransferase domain-containing protein [Myxococcales bacterium]
MSRRLGGLDDVDPAAVPLPPGTEVTTGVDRVAGDRVITRGAVGRVVAVADGWIDVELVGAGRLRYRRDELTPRKQGLIRYARRRADAWTRLAGGVVIDAIVGSRLWGLDGPGSDEDRRGVFVLPFPWTTGLVEPPGDLASADGGRAYWELGKTIRQALRADPNTLEMLFAAGDQADAVRDPIGAELVAARDAFVSVEIYGAFGRYALSQLDRLEHDARLADHRGRVLGWLRAEPTLSLDQVAARLVEAARIVAPTAADAQLRARDYVKQLYRSMYDRGQLPAREWRALVAFAAREAGHFEPPREQRPKNAYNLIRLLDLAIRWLESDETAPPLRVPDALRPTLWAIKRGEVPMAEVVAMARALTPRLE